MPPLTVKPADGGQLITRAAAVDAGIPHYTLKRNWRRDLTDEKLREGWDYFDPVPDAEDRQAIPFPAPSGQPITLIHHIRRPNGEAAVIVGTKTTLYKFNGVLEGYMENPPLYVDGVNDGYPDLHFQPYFLEPTRWQVIGDGFSPNGHRWEVVDIDGTTIFNNGTDLLVAYRVEWDFVVPLYELREQGIVCVGTIGTVNGILVLGDITELKPEDYERVLNVTRSGGIKVWQNGERYTPESVWATSDGTNVTSNADFFLVPFDNGRTLVWSNGVRQKITGVTDARHVTVQAGAPVPLGRSFFITDEVGASMWESFAIRSSEPFFSPEMEGSRIGWANGATRKIIRYYTSTLVMTDMTTGVPEGEVFAENRFTYLGREGLESQFPGITFNRRQYRVIWSELNKPTKFANRIPVTIVKDSQVLLTDRMNRSIVTGEAIAVEGGGLEGGIYINDESGNLITASAVAPGVIVASAAMLSGGKGAVQRADAVGSIVGFHDLQSDGAAILKIRALQGRAIVYTDTNIFIGRFTGQAANPFTFEEIRVEHGRSLYFRHTLVSIHNAAHIYAGKTAFYQFDLTTRQPVPIPSADLVSNLFYDYARIVDTDSIYGADNHNTQEVWFVCPANPNDPVLAFDYTYKTFSTVDQPFSAAASVKGAWQELAGETVDWFLMATADGTLLVYGLATEPMTQWNADGVWDGGRSMYYRRQARPYNQDRQSFWAKIASGLIDFGDAYNEKHVSTYLLHASSQNIPSPELTVNIYTALTQSGPVTMTATTPVTDVDNHGLVPLHYIAHLFKDEILCSTRFPVRLHQKVWDYKVLGSRSTHRKP